MRKQSRTGHLTDISPFFHILTILPTKAMKGAPCPSPFLTQFLSAPFHASVRPSGRNLPLLKPPPPCSQRDPCPALYASLNLTLSTVSLTDSSAVPQHLQQSSHTYINICLGFSYSLFSRTKSHESLLAKHVPGGEALTNPNSFALPPLPITLFLRGSEHPFQRPKLSQLLHLPPLPLLVQDG